MSILLCVNIQSLGLAREAIYVRVTSGFILERASISTLPVVNDPADKSSKQCNLSSIIMDLNNGGNMRKGVTCAASVATNHALPQNER